MTQSPQTFSDPHSFTLRCEKEVGESLELIAHSDGGITIATALKERDFCDVTQASLTRDQALELSAWLARVLGRASRH